MTRPPKLLPSVHQRPSQNLNAADPSSNPRRRASWALNCLSATVPGAFAPLSRCCAPSSPRAVRGARVRCGCGALPQFSSVFGPRRKSATLGSIASAYPSLPTRICPPGCFPSGAARQTRPLEVLRRDPGGAPSWSSGFHPRSSGSRRKATSQPRRLAASGAPRCGDCLRTSERGPGARRAS
jgi:hypothetical protein